jgi:hypothetical protein
VDFSFFLILIFGPLDWDERTMRWKYITIEGANIIGGFFAIRAKKLQRYLATIP